MFLFFIYFYRYLWFNVFCLIMIIFFIYIQIGECFLVEYLIVYCSCFIDSFNILYLLKIFIYIDKLSVIYMWRKFSKFVRNVREKLLKYIIKNQFLVVYDIK